MPRPATVRVALAQIDPTVGDLAANAATIRAAVRSAHEASADLVILPEMALTGYPIEDLALRPSFQAAARAALAALAVDLAMDGHGDVACLVGALDVTDRPVNVAALLRGGRVESTYVKHHLPNFGVFDEGRYFAAGEQAMVFDVAGVRVATAICEDLWHPGGPVQWAAQAGADVLAVLNASPYEHGKDDVRLDLCRRRAAESGATLAYVNLVGGQDELVFDGGSLVVAPDGALLARGRQFAEDLVVVDVPPANDDARAVATAEPLGPLAAAYAALVVGLRDYVRKNGFASVLLGLSGGIDSALVATIACDAIGADRVHGIALPSQYSSDHSVTDAYDLAERTGLAIRTISIAPMVEAFQDQLSLTGLAEENLQARVRGTTLMAVSNAEGHLVLATGNKSELSVGYSTIYGDAVGGFAPIKDVPKTLVWQLARWRNDEAVAAGQRPPIPSNSITKPPSAELRPGQQDSDSLPDYATLDALLAEYVDADAGADDLVAHGFAPDLVDRVTLLTDRAEYKRRQYPPGTKISLRAFGRDRRLPVTSRWRETAAIAPRTPTE